MDLFAPSYERFQIALRKNFPEPTDRQKDADGRTYFTPPGRQKRAFVVIQEDGKQEVADMQAGDR